MPERSMLPDNEERMAAARRVANWELGDETWADLIVEAYRDPDPANEYMDRLETSDA